ncbi:MAG: dihydropteroate synthase [Actinomycetia bacterium]|nr:dihydropteroate synthase [Actinomycetes bacterium]
MGIVNATPDSFSDGGDRFDPDLAIAAGLQMVQDGATIVDVGGESTRPGAATVPAEEEIARVVPIVEALSGAGVVVSVDTSKAAVASACIAVGASIVNDVTALGDPAMASVCAESGVGVVLMHMAGSPGTMQDDPVYSDVVVDVAAFLQGRASGAEAAGIEPGSISIDPGIGFGKTVWHNIELMRNLGTFVEMGYPVTLGTSRKRFLEEILRPIRGSTPPRDRDGATAATVALAVSRGVQVIRVHNVRLAVDVGLTANAMVTAEDHDQEDNRA